MNKTLLFILLVALPHSTHTSHIEFTLSGEDVLFLKEIRRQKEISNFSYLLRTQEEKLYILAMRESARIDLDDTVPNYKIYNKQGFVGAWQINIRYMKYLDMPEFTIEEFMNHPDSVFPPELQLIAVKRLIEKNRYYLRDYWHYVGKTVRGIEITEEGMLFAAHLAGNGGLKSFFKYGRNPKDANGTKLSDYLDYKNNFTIL